MNTRVVTIDPDRIEPALIAEAAECLRGGGLVAFPTETVYGLGADALNESAFRAIFAAKGRPNDNPIILHISNTDALETLAAEVPEYAARLMRSFWPGPLTIVLKKRAGLPDYVTAGLGTVAVRMPSHPIALALIREAGRPVAAPSANRSGKPSPTRAEHVARDLSGKVDMIVDGGAAGIGLESTVVDATGGGGAPVVILRPGGVSREAIAAVVGAGNVAGAREEADRCCAAGAGSGDAAAADVGAGMSALTGPPADAPPISPGTKYRHYAPDAEMLLLRGPREKVAHWISRILYEHNPSGDIGVLASDETLALLTALMAHNTGGGWSANRISLGGAGDAAAAAGRLFSALRAFDGAGVARILCEAYPTDGIGLALADRMTRAASGNILDTAAVRRVLFVCTGNTCRSAMAEALFNAAAARETAAAASVPIAVPVAAQAYAAAAQAVAAVSRVAVVAVSAGISAFDGDPAAPEAVQALREDFGVNVSEHRARRLTPELLCGADLILTMTRTHRDAILALRPGLFSRVFTLAGFVRGLVDPSALSSPNADDPRCDDIPDPFGRGLEAYRLCARQLARLIEPLARFC